MVYNQKFKIISIMIIVFLIPSSTFAIATTSNLNFLNSEIRLNHINYIDENTPPNPPIINGPTTGKSGTLYYYSFTLSDIDEGDFLTILEVNFENSIESVIKKNCERPWYNGTIISMQHQWKENDNYSITARVMDSNGEWSNWSEPFEISMSKNKIFNFQLFQFLENHPQLFPLLQKLMNQ